MGLLGGSGDCGLNRQGELAGGGGGATVEKLLEWSCGLGNSLGQGERGSEFSG